jgi:hypothetical protein
MRCSAYEGCQLQVRRGADFFFLKAFPACSFPGFSKVVRLFRGARVSQSCPALRDHQLLCEQHRFGCAHDVVPDLGKPPWAARAPSNR